jgi:hypothetical protein
VQQSCLLRFGRTAAARALLRCSKQRDTQADRGGRLWSDTDARQAVHDADPHGANQVFASPNTRHQLARCHRPACAVACHAVGSGDLSECLLSEVGGARIQ